MPLTEDDVPLQSEASVHKQRESLPTSPGDTHKDNAPSVFLMK